MPPLWASLVLRVQRAQRALTRPPPRLPSRHLPSTRSDVAFRPASRTTSMTRPRRTSRGRTGRRRVAHRLHLVHRQRTREVSEQASSRLMRSEGIAQPNLLMSHSRTISPATAERSTL